MPYPKKRRPRGVVDTSVLVAGIVAFRQLDSPVPSAIFLRDWIENDTFLRLISEAIVEEYKEILALKYKQLWRVEEIFRSMKSLLDTRPVFPKCDETIRGHVFCSFLALVLRKELEDRLARRKWKLEWADVIRDLDNLMEMEVAIDGKGYVFRGQTTGESGKVFQACGVALPPVLRPC